jgi:hypothetical protein
LATSLALRPDLIDNSVMTTTAEFISFKIGENYNECIERVHALDHPIALLADTPNKPARFLKAERALSKVRDELYEEITILSSQYFSRCLGDTAVIGIIATVQGVLCRET